MLTTVKTSVVDIINEYSEIMLNPDPVTKEEQTKKFFTDDMTNVRMKEEWGDLTQEQVNLVIATFEDTVIRISNYFEELNAQPKLKLAKE